MVPLGWVWLCSAPRKQSGHDIFGYQVLLVFDQIALFCDSGDTACSVESSLLYLNYGINRASRVEVDGCGGLAVDRCFTTQGLESPSSQSRKMWILR